MFTLISLTVSQHLDADFLCLCFYNKSFHCLFVKGVASGQAMFQADLLHGKADCNREPKAPITAKGMLLQAKLAG